MMPCRDEDGWLLPPLVICVHGNRRVVLILDLQWINPCQFSGNLLDKGIDIPLGHDALLALSATAGPFLLLVLLLVIVLFLILDIALLVIVLDSSMTTKAIGFT